MSSIKLIVMGSGGVGKSALTNRFIQGEFIETYDPTIEDQYQKTLEVDDAAYHLEILDTAGQEEYSVLREGFMGTGDGFILVYSITDDATLDELREIREEILSVNENPEVPLLLVGNKCDLAEDRAVSDEEGKALAKEFNCGQLEASAKEDINVTEMFRVIVRRILEENEDEDIGQGGATVMGAGETAEVPKPAAAPAKKTGKKTKKKFPCVLL
eukprot:PLAT2747.1.p2 GENE.PLAT2747.1~~PLAT2747.1.p2  ORF type:complete len:214 (+),score=91.15 PLAT2747.1:58-699(+)